MSGSDGGALRLPVPWQEFLDAVRTGLAYYDYVPVVPVGGGSEYVNIGPSDGPEVTIERTVAVNHGDELFFNVILPSEVDPQSVRFNPEVRYTTMRLPVGPSGMTMVAGIRKRLAW